MRFTVKLYNSPCLSAGTYDELYSRILAFHARRQKAVQFRLDFKLNDGYGSYEITDHWDDAS